MNRYVEAKLISPTQIHVMITNPNRDVDYIFTLIIDNATRFLIKPMRITKKENSTLYQFNLEHSLELGHIYNVAITHFGIYPLNVDAMTMDPNFDKKYYYDGDDLGAIYSKSKTSFAIWAPLASHITLWLDGFKAYNMLRDKKGVYRLTINKDLLGHRYHYYVTNSGVTMKALDPYAKASTPNSMDNVIIDTKSFNIQMNDNKLVKLNSNLDAIIYEGSVRDLTSDPNTSIKNKGKFLGLVEEGRVNKDKMPVGFDYITSLGITHLQLLPIFDFKTTDELHPKDTYNWGYDPIQYFIPEGSYASDVRDPNSRIRDLLTLVSKFHSRGIRIVMDVVFNHIYEHQFSPFEAVVPNYYFRRMKDGMYFNASGCGNDLATERPMVRKLIVDACKWWVKFYHIDGFRFDLMGLIDVETINAIKKETLKINPNMIFYGEGWNMLSGYNLTLANSDNYLRVPNVAFFNDSYRDLMVGNLGRKEVGFGFDNIVYREGFKEAYLGSALNYSGDGSRFNNPSYSINFVECHDNNTLFDKLQILRKGDQLKDKLKRISFINGLLMYSFGIPFFHAGQEIGLSKGGVENSYCSGDKVNFFDYSLLKSRSFMVDEFKTYVKNRKNIQLFHSDKNDNICNNVDIKDIDNGGLLITFDSYLYKERRKAKLNIFVNPSFLKLNHRDERRKVTIDPIAIRIIEEK